MLVSVLATVAAACLGLAPAANAAPPASAGAKTHCAVNVSNNSMKCFSSFKEAIALATGGKVTNAPTSAAEATADASFAAAVNAADDVSAATNTLIGVEWWNKNYSGNDLDFYGTSGKCSVATTDVDYVASDLYSWNNKISSFFVYGDCLQKSWDNINYKGSNTGWRGDTANLTDVGWNDRIESIKWS
jgi:hypothetical protein